jgi:MoaA/NifB/PqqE/SkfB family radical SAM enzyme
MIQFIGGEPTMHPSFTQIMSHALQAGLDVEVYSNLVHVTDEMWELFQSPRVSLAFSYFASDAKAHNAVTGRTSHKATRRNAEKAARLGIPIRAGVIDFGHVPEAISDLKSIGITKVATDRVRHIGRGGDHTPAPTELCGRCGHDVAAISADGDVSPCIFTRWLSAGNVRQAPLADILASPQMTAALATIPPRPPRSAVCDPNEECPPGFPPSSCDPRN